METLTEILAKADKAQELLFKAEKKRDEIANMPYYEIYGKPGELENDLNKMTLVILRIQNYFVQKIKQARDTKI